MKAKTSVILLLAVLLFSTTGSYAATNEVSGLLQKGLFEEEANRNLGAAITAYQAVITQTDKDHQFAATAVFRLGECYRKLGRTNEANVQYQRILREFADQPELVKLSEQQVGRPAGNGLGELFETGRKIAAAQEEFDTAQRQLNELTGLPPEKLRIAVQQNHPNPVLDSLMQKMVDAERGLVRLKSDFGPDAPLVKTSAADFENIQRQIDEQVSGVTNGLMVKMQMAQKTLQTLGAPNTRPASNSGTTEPSNTEGDEVRRFQNLIRDNPDLVNAKDGGGYTPLDYAASTNALEIARFLLANGADVNAVSGNSGRETPLHLAARAGNKEMVELLLAKGANPNAADSSRKETPLHLATKAGFKSIVDLLLNHQADVNAGNSSDMTALHLAVQNGFKAVAESLLAHGADVNAHNMAGYKPIDIAASAGKVMMMELLLTNHADINAKDNDGNTALHRAVEGNQLEAAKWLIAHGANVNAALTGANNAGTTALHLAVAQNQNDIVRLLLESGANPNLPSKFREPGNNYDGFTALHIAVHRNQPESAALLLQNKADVDLQDERGNTALFLAVLARSRPLVALLLAHHANTELRNKGDQWPLRYAVETGQTDICEVLLQGGADANAAPKSNGQTPLFVALLRPDPTLVKLLLDHHAEVNRQDANGQTPLSLAESIGPGDKREELVKLLKDAGANNNLRRISHITVSRTGSGQTPYYSADVFYKRTNSVNRFTLFELVASVYGVRHLPNMGPNNFNPGLFNAGRVPTILPVMNAPPPGVPQALGPNERFRFPFPDFGRVKISRLNSKTGDSETIEIDLETAFRSGDCDKNVWLEWGDDVEIPEADHVLSESWIGLPKDIVEGMTKCMERKVEVIRKGQTNTIGLVCVVFGVGASLGPTVVSAPASTTRLVGEPRFWLSQAIRDSNLLLASSDTTRVKVRRVDPETKQVVEMVFDLGKVDPNTDLWLRDGDVIEIPEK